jgi:hypothetical protein
MVRGPGIQSESTCDVPVTGCDLYPTLAQLAGIRSVNEVDGQSLVGLLRGGRRFNRENALLFYYPHYGRNVTAKPQGAIFKDNFKLVKNLESGEVELFNLNKDIGEANDLSNQMPEKAEELIKLLDRRLEKTGAQLMLPNENYDANAEPVVQTPRGQQGAGGPGGRAGRAPQSPDAFMERFDKDKDGKVTKDEFDGRPNRWQILDADGDGIIRKEDVIINPQGRQQQGGQ